jgi:hypothetical protein
MGFVAVGAGGGSVCKDVMSLWIERDIARAVDSFNILNFVAFIGCVFVEDTD